MKKVMIIIMVLGSFAMSAQNKMTEKKETRKELRANLTPEQRAELRSKKMTLQLNLNDSQQKKVNQLFLDLEKNKPNYSENKKEMTSEAKYDLKKSQMDRMISMKRQFKEILTTEQFEKWEKSLSEKRSYHKKDFRQYKRERQ